MIHSEQEAHLEVPFLEDKPVLIMQDRKEFRCPRCGKLLMIADLGEGTIVEIKCTRNKCRTVARFTQI